MKNLLQKKAVACLDVHTIHANGQFSREVYFKKSGRGAQDRGDGTLPLYLGLQYTFQNGFN
jgi:hypothetical protein